MLTTTCMVSDEHRTAPRPPVAGFRILGQRGFVRFENMRRGDEPIVIGRDPECDIRIADSTVSRQHCEIVLTIDGTCMIQDKGSTNGIRVSEIGHDRGYRRVAWQVLEPGKFVQLGRVTLVMVDAEGQCPIAAIKHGEWLRLGFKVYTSERGVERHMAIKRRMLARALPKRERPRMEQSP